ncbi:AAL075Wp [Eremothecium gossypii ATCC 10895]|uniref:AAL075Wp n=1 Tax=Eremothecium gossypii (strain ATCC 10895 / CBS 109.51 / FGSC 9923 / NRRL Y-1056) TaxID=284811 RepID=Q75F03_EREGS|nr:AAL075Wp [Eremothecium gossypii ATCC 10895]AAS50291.1 AAL075Wp [Eremothecium gossypii ATCC 10895]AEY94577.1 FAAL075Wp [Eremothecium gossypii FDAG1]
MSQIYLNSSMLVQLNATVQEFISDWLEHYSIHQQTLNPTQRILQFGTTTTVVLLGFLYLMGKWFLGPGNGGKPVPFELAVPEAAQKHWKGKRLFSASVYDPQQPGMIQNYCPATGQFLGSFRSMSKEDIDERFAAAAKAQVSWAKTSFAQRRQVLKTMQKFVLENQEMLARVACRDSGKTMLDASLGEIMVTMEKLQWMIKHGERTLRPSKRAGPANFFMKLYKGGEVRYEPLGVVGAVVSWNYSFHNTLGPIIASTFAGNGVVIKCSEQVVWSSEFFVKLARESLKVCGHDPELVQLCYCFPPSETDDTANYFTSHPSLRHLTFIGSKPVAHHVLACAAKSLTPVVVELGGKDALVVLDSAKDLESLSSIIMRGTFQSAGQNCIGIERVIVCQKNYDALVKILEHRISELRVGADIDNLEDVDVGAMISDNRFDYMEELIQDAVSQGARLLHGGSRYTHPKYPQGHYFQPTLLVDVTTDMRISQNEVFGPVLTVMKAKDIEDCIRIANDTPFGLGGSVFGKNRKDCNYVANHMNVGNVAINDFATYYVCQLPFGGIGSSGYGRFGGEEGLLGLCNSKSICYDKVSWISTFIPPPVDYPIKSSAGAWNFARAFITGAYTNSLWQRAKSILELAKGGR